MLKRLLRSIVHTGTLTLIRPNGRRDVIGSGEPAISVRVHDWRAMLRLGIDPDLALGELYMDGRLTVEDGDIADLLALLMMNLAQRNESFFLRVGRAYRRLMRPLAQYNPISRAKEHVAHHYDLSSDLYNVFLDPDRQYSCAYFSAPGESLDDAQIGKKRHIAAKLNLNKPGLRVLDIGCGWGGLALDLARDCKADVLGITLSEEQIAMARQRSANAKLSDHCRFELTDYRVLKGQFDRIASVGMLEHVGVHYYPQYFGQISKLLADDGVALVHSIGRSDGAGATNPWIAKYIFPGGYTPALSEILPIIERAGLMVSDVEVLRLHYAETLKAWRSRFKARWDDVAKIYDERFCRMWEFYLAGAEMGFRYEGLVVFQVQLVKNVNALPMTRDYMYEAERSMRFAGTEHMPRPVRVA